MLRLAEESSGGPHLPGLSVVIPAYNEVTGVGGTLSELRGILARLDLEWEILVVDDGSQDGTADAVKPFLDERVRLIRHAENRGYGAALKTGIHKAAYPYILITDSDGTYPARHVPELVARLEEHRLVVGARLGKNAHGPLIRRPPKWALRRLASYLSQVKILDLNSGLRLFPKELALRFLRVLPNGFSFTSTLTLAALSLGYDVSYVPIDYRHRKGRSKIRPIRDTLAFLHLIVRTLMFFDPMRVLLPVSLFFFAGSVGVGVGSYLLTGRLMDVTTVLLFVTGVQILALGMIAEAINRRLP